MPPQVGRANEGSKPITQTSSEGVSNISSPQVGKQPAQKQPDSAQNETSSPRKASAKEAGDKKGDVEIKANYNRNQLERKLDQDRILHGTKGDDQVHVSNAQGLLGKFGFYQIDINGRKEYVTPEQLKHTKIATGNGNDTVLVDPDVKVGVKVDGGRGDDVIVGGGGADQLSGGRGHDILLGRGGNDKLSGEAGNDLIMGGQGHDFMDGGPGKNKNLGGSGFDVSKSSVGDYIGRSEKK